MIKIDMEILKDYDDLLTKTKGSQKHCVHDGDEMVVHRCIEKNKADLVALIHEMQDLTLRCDDLYKDGTKPKDRCFKHIEAIIQQLKVLLLSEEKSVKNELELWKSDLSLASTEFCKSKVEPKKESCVKKYEKRIVKSKAHLISALQTTKEENLNKQSFLDRTLAINNSKTKGQNYQHTAT